MSSKYQDQMYGTGKGASQQRSQDADQHEQANGQGANPAPTRRSIADRSASPDNYVTSGMERAMHQQANKVHPIKRR